MNKYHSQSGQDRFLNEMIFHGNRNGVFLDIGASDGITFSNSYFFEKELGWTGICFEPLKSAFAKLDQCRTSINFNACAAKEDKVDQFLSVAGYGEMLSGLKSKYDERHLQRVADTIKEHGGSVHEVEVQCVDVNRILEIHSFSDIDFISIDTEGNELEILQTLDFDKTHIKAITVENNYQSAAFNDFLSGKGFYRITTLDADEVYVNKADFGILRRYCIQYIRRFLGSRSAADA